MLKFCILKNNYNFICHMQEHLKLGFPTGQPAKRQMELKSVLFTNIQTRKKNELYTIGVSLPTNDCGKIIKGAEISSSKSHFSLVF